MNGGPFRRRVTLLRMRRFLPVVLLATLTLTGCADDGGLSSVKLTGGKHPKLSVSSPLMVTKSATRVIKPGAGHTIATGDLVRVRSIAANGSDGKSFSDAFTTDTPTYVPIAKEAFLPPYFANALKGHKKGAELLVAVPSVVWSKSTNPDSMARVGVTKQDALLFYFQIDDVIPKGYDVKGKAAQPTDGAPVATFKNGKPVSITAGAATPDQEAVYVLQTGTGKKLAEGGNYAAQYFGQVFPNGKKFDQSWDDGTALGGDLDSLIKCWQDLLPGAQEGSRLILVCPKDVAYGATQNELKNDTLMFVIDVVDVA